MRNTKKCGNYLCEFVLCSQTQVPYFSSHSSSCSQFLCRIFLIFGSFAIFNLNRLLIFNDGSRYGSVTQNIDQLVQVNRFTYLKRFILLFGPSAASNHRRCYVTIGNPAFCLFLYLIGVHFRGELHHGGDAS